MAPQFDPLRGRLSFLYKNSTGSTNADLLADINAGKCFNRQVLQAGSQTLGRGRMGRHWASEPGNLFISLAFQARHDLSTLAQASFVVPLAVRDFVARLDPAIDLRLKWPNDVLAGNDKLSGILLETARYGDDPAFWLVVGVGINLQSAPSLANHGTTSIKALSPKTDLSNLPQLGRFFADCLAARLDAWQARGFEPVREDWLAAAARLGEEITVGIGEQQKTGIFKGLARDGALQLELAPGQIQTIHAGDVIWPGLSAPE